MPTKTLSYIHTPPRAFCDQWETNLAKTLAKVPEPLSFLRPVLQSILEWFRRLVLKQFASSLQATDYVVTNSVNIQGRTHKFLQVQANEVIYPAVNTSKFQFLGQLDYYHSHCRLESLKRIELIVEAFEHLPHKKLVITSSGPLQDWLQNQIKTKNLTNIDFRGRVSDEELVEIMGNCIAGIMIPVDEDAGITQIEFLAAGKPVVAVAEGGLLETICGPKQQNLKIGLHENTTSEIDSNNLETEVKNTQLNSPKENLSDNLENLQTGILIPESPTLQDLINGIEQMTPSLALSLKDNCQKVAQNYDQKIFFEKLDKAIAGLGVNLIR